jgi:GNAT superfamily N-acetyltransferase
MSPLELRPIEREEVASIVDLIQRAIERGCREHYDSAQRHAVFLTCAQELFSETPGTFASIVVVRNDAPVGFTQFDPTTGRLRALFVDGDVQHLGIGTLLITAIERRVRLEGGKRLYGAMSLNAVAFYTLAGFRSLGGPERHTCAGVLVPLVRMEKLFLVEKE